MLEIFKKKDPVCGMKEKKGSGITKNGKWFCSEKCVNEFEKSQKNHGGSCCH